VGISFPDCVPARIVLEGGTNPAFPSSIALSERFLWLSMFVILASIALAVVIGGFASVTRMFRTSDRVERWLVGASLAVAIAWTVAIAFSRAKTFLLVDQLLGTLGPLPPGVAHFLQTIAGIARAVTFAAACTLAAMACTTLGAAATGPTEDRLRLDIERLQTVLYLGGALLALAILEFKLFFDWVVLAFPSPQQEQLRPIIAASVAGSGALYSLFLAATYWPASLVLRSRATALSRQLSPDLLHTERSTWLESRGLVPSWARTAMRVAVVLGPYLASTPLNALVGAFRSV
jgi:hypothetical protein